MVFLIFFQKLGFDISCKISPKEGSDIYEELRLKYNVQYNFNDSNTDGSFTTANSNSLFESLGYSSNSSTKHFFFFLYRENVCWVYSSESPHRGDSDEYTQHTFISYTIEKTSLNYPYLPNDLEL